MNIGTSVNAIQQQTKQKRGGGGVPTSVSRTGECVYSGSVYASALYRKPLCWCCKGVGMYVSTLLEEVWVGGGGGGFQGQGNSCLV